jgi:hypothetical protein
MQEAIRLYHEKKLQPVILDWWNILMNP